MRMTSAERVILQNQSLIMRALSAILHAPGVSSGTLHREISQAVYDTDRVVKGGQE